MIFFASTIGFARSSGGKNCSFTCPQAEHEKDTGIGKRPALPEGLKMADTQRNITVCWWKKVWLAHFSHAIGVVFLISTLGFSFSVSGWFIICFYSAPLLVLLFLNFCKFRWCDCPICHTMHTIGLPTWFDPNYVGLPLDFRGDDCCPYLGFYLCL